MPVGLKSPAKHPPSRLRSNADLRALQRLMTATLVRPLSPSNRLQARWLDGRPMAKVAAEFIKPNDRLTSFERLEIYARCYWFRVLDCFYDDCPALRTVLGEKKFGRLAETYLAKYPSRSFNLRNLCSRLEKFIREEPRFTAPHTELALDVARFEWAQIEAFDGLSA
ncbi:MAG: putative DNA-binding domain-containing protein, partial [Verrucomicrobiota bacterium]|nr:putative DNA-binding domain-containing protein [Verrucomicrobiota bacterium]